MNSWRPSAWVGGGIGDGGGDDGDDGGGGGGGGGSGRAEAGRQGGATARGARAQTHTELATQGEALQQEQGIDAAWAALQERGATHA